MARGAAAAAALFPDGDVDVGAPTRAATASAAADAAAEVPFGDGAAQRILPDNPPNSREGCSFVAGLHSARVAALEQQL